MRRAGFKSRHRSTSPGQKFSTADTLSALCSSSFERLRNLTEGDNDEKYHLFASRSWSHPDHYDRLIRMLRQHGYSKFTDYSVPRNAPIHNATAIALLRRAICDKMSLCGVVLTMSGVYAMYSKWIDKEIKLAGSGFKMPRPIIAVKLRGNERTSIRATRAADRIVGWNAESVAQAIRELA